MMAKAIIQSQDNEPLNLTGAFIPERRLIALL